MKCPKCGFGQPDDIYCALCGINVKKYAQKKKTRYLKVGVLGILGGLAVLLAVNHFLPSSELDRAEAPEGETFVSPERQRRQGRFETNMARNTESSSSSFDNRSVLDRQAETQRTDFGASPQEEPDFTPAPKAAEDQLETAEQWFERGRSLDDDSENEIEYYKTALEIDPEFAPAAFYLGAIHFRKARYELADEYFTTFLKHASEQERRTHDIYVYYSLADVERLYDAIAQESAQEEGTSDQEAGQGNPPSGEEEGAGVNGEPQEEVLTVVEYQRINGHITVPIVLNGFYTARLLVDTGAGITIVSRETARHLGLQDLGDKPITLRTLAMDVRAERGRLDSIQVGNLRKYDFPVAIADPPFGVESKFSGILGMDFMKDYSINISNKTREITLSNRVIKGR